MVEGFRDAEGQKGAPSCPGGIDWGEDGYFMSLNEQRWLVSVIRLMVNEPVLMHMTQLAKSEAFHKSNLYQMRALGTRVTRTHPFAKDFLRRPANATCIPEWKCGTPAARPQTRASYISTSERHQDCILHRMDARVSNAHIYDKLSYSWKIFHEDRAIMTQNCALWPRITPMPPSELLTAV